MAEIARKTGSFPLFSIDTPSRLTVFGNTTLSTDIDDIVDTNEFKLGWGYLGGILAPPEQDFNALGYSLSYVASYYLQKGIPEWDGIDTVIGGQEYIANKSYVGYGGDIYVSLLDSGGSLAARVPTNATYWKKVSSVGLDINGQTNKTTPIDTDNFILQEVGGLFKKLTWSNLKATLLTYFDTLYSKLGVGQTQQDVTGSRVSGTTYTNSTGKPIHVFINGYFSGGGPFTFEINTVVQGSYTYVANGYFSFSFIIPNGATYKATCTFTKWSELR